MLEPPRKSIHLFILESRYESQIVKAFISQAFTQKWREQFFLCAKKIEIGHFVFASSMTSS